MYKVIPPYRMHDNIIRPLATPVTNVHTCLHTYIHITPTLLTMLTYVRTLYLYAYLKYLHYLATLPPLLKIHNSYILFILLTIPAYTYIA